MKRLTFKVERGSHGGVSATAFLNDNDDVVDELSNTIWDAVHLDVLVTIGDVTMPACMWEDPEHWATNWAEKLSVDLDDAPRAVLNLLADTITEDKPRIPKTMHVEFDWSTEHGACYECGLPAAFLVPDAYGDVPLDDKHKRCSVCAANAAAGGERVTRILDACTKTVDDHTMVIPARSTRQA